MDYKKFQADYLFTGNEMLHNGEVLIALSNGTIKAIVPAEDAGEEVQKVNGVLCPGFINTHCHLELSHLKGAIPLHTGLVDFVLHVMTKRFVDPEVIQQAIQWGEADMFKNGIVAVGDVCNTPNTLMQKQHATLQYYNFIETSGWIPAAAEKRFEQSYSLYAQFASPKSIVPHAPYSVANALWQQIIPYFKGAVITMHNQETLAEDALFKSGNGDFLRLYQHMQINNELFIPSGKSSLQTVMPNFAQAHTLLLVHNTFTSKEDIEQLKQWALQNNVAVFAVLCINANLYIEQQVPPANMLTEAGINITIGTDSLASNYTLSVLDELIQLNQYFPHIPLSHLLQWATYNGAKALGMDNLLGSFTPNYQPGILQLTGINVLHNQLHKAQVKRLL